MEGTSQPRCPSPAVSRLHPRGAQGPAREPPGMGYPQGWDTAPGPQHRSPTPRPAPAGRGGAGSRGGAARRGVLEAVPPRGGGAHGWPWLGSARPFLPSAPHRRPHGAVQRRRQGRCGALRSARAALCRGRRAHGAAWPRPCCGPARYGRARGRWRLGRPRGGSPSARRSGRAPCGALWGGPAPGPNKGLRGLPAAEPLGPAPEQRRGLPEPSRAPRASGKRPGAAPRDGTALSGPAVAAAGARLCWGRVGAGGFLPAVGFPEREAGASVPRVERKRRTRPSGRLILVPQGSD